MSKRTFSLAVAIVLALGSLQSASAQSVFNPTGGAASAPRPALSPYLNLLRGGDPAANYYLGVLPEQQRRQFEANTMNLLAPSLPYTDPFVDDRADIDMRERQLPPTGHTAGFMIYNSYYRVPNQHSFIPYNPNVNNPGSRQPVR